MRWQGSIVCTGKQERMVSTARSFLLCLYFLPRFPHISSLLAFFYILSFSSPFLTRFVSLHSLSLFFYRLSLSFFSSNFSLTLFAFLSSLLPCVSSRCLILTRFFYFSTDVLRHPVYVHHHHWRSTSEISVFDSGNDTQKGVTRVYLGLPCFRPSPLRHVQRGCSVLSKPLLSQLSVLLSLAASVFFSQPSSFAVYLLFFLFSLIFLLPSSSLLSPCACLFVHVRYVFFSLILSRLFLSLSLFMLSATHVLLPLSLSYISTTSSLLLLLSRPLFFSQVFVIRHFFSGSGNSKLGL